VTLPVATVDLQACTCTVIDMDDASACALGPPDADAMPWLVTDPAPGYIAFPLAPPVTTLRVGSPLFYERRRAMFKWTMKDDVVGITELTITVWNLAGYPTATECPDPAPPPPPILGRDAAVQLALPTPPQPAPRPAPNPYGRAAVYRIPQLG